MVSRGPGLAATTLRTDTRADINRGRLRGWAAIAAVLLAALAILSWPNLLGFLAFLAATAACAAIAVWVHLGLPDVEKEGVEEPVSRTGGRD